MEQFLFDSISFEQKKKKDLKNNFFICNVSILIIQGISDSIFKAGFYDTFKPNGIRGKSTPDENVFKRKISFLFNIQIYL